MSALIDSGLDWAHGASGSGVLAITDPPTTDPTIPTEVGEVVITARKSGLVFSGILSASDMAPVLEASGYSASVSQDVGFGVASNVAQSLAGRDISTVGVAIADRTTLPAGQTMLDTAILNYPGNTPPAFPQVAVAISDNHFGYAYIDSDFDGDWDRVIQLGPIT